MSQALLAGTCIYLMNEMYTGNVELHIDLEIVGFS